MVRSIGLCMTLLFLSGCAVLGFAEKGKKRPDNSATDRKRKLADDVEDAEEDVRDAGDEDGGGSGKRAPKVKVSDDDPSEIREAAAEVEKMEEALESGDFAAYGTAQGRARRSLDEDDAKESSKRKRSLPGCAPSTSASPPRPAVTRPRS